MTEPGLALAARRNVSIRVVSLGLALALGGAGLLACSSRHPSRPAPGAAGGGLDAGNVIHQGPTDADAGRADAATPTSSVDPTLACIEYMRGQCERVTRCNNPGESAEPCVANYARHCPDTMYAPGSTRTPEQVLACADDWRELACDAELGRPQCATPGTRAAGEPCIASIQCASLICTSYGNSCGICAQVVRVDEACDEAAGVYCPDYHYCSEGACVPLESPRAPLQLGAECDPNTTACGRNDCRVDTQGVYGCQPYPTLGQSCSETLTCAYGDSYCDINQICTAFPAVGESCGVDGFSGEPRWCGHDASCVGTDPEARICATLPGPGDVCTWLCAADRFCACDGAACESRHCVRWRYPGESCAEPGDECVAGACDGGSCSKQTEHGQFDSVCAADAGANP